MSDICTGYYSLREKPCQVTKLVQLAKKNVWASMFYFPMDKHSNIHQLKSRARNVWKLQNFAYIKLDLVIHCTTNSTRKQEFDYLPVVNIEHNEENASLNDLASKEIIWKRDIVYGKLFVTEVKRFNFF